MSSPTLLVNADHRGGWLVAVPERDAPVRCQSLHEARDLAHRLALEMQPCDVVVHDAYERVVERERVGEPSAR